MAWAKASNSTISALQSIVRPEFLDLLRSPFTPQPEKPLRFRFVPFAQWTTDIDDQLVVDTLHNMGYILKRGGKYTMFRVVTGKDDFVYYMRLHYYAATPNTSWVALSKEKQNDPVTFGEDETFFRLYDKNGKIRTSYGIHTHKYADVMLARNKRYESMGCIIVSEEVLKVIDDMFMANDGSLPVTTVYGIESVLPEANALELSPAGS